MKNKNRLHSKSIWLIGCLAILILSSCSLNREKDMVMEEDPAAIPTIGSVSSEQNRTEEEPQLISDIYLEEATPELLHEPEFNDSTLPQEDIDTETSISITPTNKPISIAPTPTPAPTATPIPTPKPTKAPEVLKRPTPTEVLKVDIVSEVLSPLPSRKDYTNAVDFAKLVIKSIITKDMDEVARVKAVHDYIVLNTAYDSEGLQNDNIPRTSFTEEGVLRLGIAVCQGYAYAFQLFMDLLGIDSKIVVGTADGISHAWNMVKLNGSWYHIDVTWNDPVPDKKGEVQYQYFLVTDQVLAPTHIWERRNYPAAEGIEYRYYIYKDNIIPSITDYEEHFIKRYNSGERTIILLYPQEGTPDFEFLRNYEYLWKLEDGVYRIYYYLYPTWRNGDYTVLKVVME